MSKIITDTIQRPSGTGLTIPSADGTAGQLLKTDGSGGLEFKTYTPGLPVVWDSATSGTTPEYVDITSSAGKALRGFQINWYNVSPDAVAQPRIYPLDSGGSPIGISGNINFTYYGMYNGTTRTGSNSNSDHVHLANYNILQTASTSGIGMTGYGVFTCDPNGGSINGKGFWGYWDISYKQGTGTEQAVRYYGSCGPDNTATGSLTADLGGIRFRMNNSGNSLTSGMITCKAITV